MKTRFNKVYAIVLGALLCSASALLARKVPPNVAFATIQIYNELEQADKLDRLSSSFITFYENLIAGNDTSNDMTINAIIREVRQYGYLKRTTHRTPRHTN